MKLLFVFTVIFAAIMLMAAIRNKRNCHRLFGELERMKASVADICLLLPSKTIEDYEDYRGFNRYG